MKDKKGIVPKPASSGYRAGTVEDPRVLEGKKGHDLNKVTEIAPSPETSDRESSHPSQGPGRKKSAAHGSEYPGVATPTAQTVRECEAKPVSRDVVNTQLGSNRRLGN